MRASACPRPALPAERQTDPPRTARSEREVRSSSTSRLRQVLTFLSAPASYPRDPKTPEGFLKSGLLVTSMSPECPSDFAILVGLRPQRDGLPANKSLKGETGAQRAPRGGLTLLALCCACVCRVPGVDVDMRCIMSVRRVRSVCFLRTS